MATVDSFSIMYVSIYDELSEFKGQFGNFKLNFGRCGYFLDSILKARSDEDREHIYVNYVQ